MNAMMRDAELCNARLKAQSKDDGPTVNDVYRVVMAMSGEMSRLNAKIAILDTLLRPHAGREAGQAHAEPKPMGLPIAAVIREAAGVHGVAEMDIMSKSRLRSIAWARFHCWHILHIGGRSFPWIGQRFGAHHTTVIHGVRQWEEHGERYLRDSLGLPNHSPSRGISAPAAPEHEKGNPESFLEGLRVVPQQVPVAFGLRAHKEAGQ